MVPGNCLSLNVSKTKELFVGLQKESAAALHSSYDQWDPCGEGEQLFKYLGVNIPEDLTWTTHIQTQVKKPGKTVPSVTAEEIQGLTSNPENFLSGTIESVLTQCISVWYGNSSSQDCKALQRVVRLAERILGSSLPLSAGHLPSNATKAELSKSSRTQIHPGNRLFILLPSGKRFRSLMAKTESP